MARTNEGPEGNLAKLLGEACERQRALTRDLHQLLAARALPAHGFLDAVRGALQAVEIVRDGTGDTVLAQAEVERARQSLRDLDRLLEAWSLQSSARRFR